VRPLTLELQGFTAFRDRQTISLADLDLFVITGPTGAGKSSLLDAMVFALFGKVPRMGGQGLSDLVSHGVAEARISLEFSNSGERYRVARRLSRTRAASATFERAEGNEWRSDVEGSGVRVVDRRVVDLLKLDFDAFTRAVVLPQGEFQRFLRGEPDKRREVLTELLGLKHYAAMGARARARIAALQARTLATQEILDNQYAEARAEHLAAAESVAASARVRADALADAVVIVTELDQQAAGLRAARPSLQERAAQLVRIRSALGDQLVICERAQTREQERGHAVAEATERTAGAHAQRAGAQVRRDDLVRAHGTMAELARTEGAIEALGQLTEDLTTKRALLAALIARHAEITAQAQTARGHAGALTSSADAARTAADQLRHAVEAATRKATEATTRLDAAQRADGELRAATLEVDRCTAEVARTQPAADAAAQAELAALAERARLSDEHSAAALANHLSAGDPCPICHRTLDEPPRIDRHVAEALSAAVTASQAAAAAAAAARDAGAAAQAAARAAAARLGRARESLAAALGDAASVVVVRQEAGACTHAQTELVTAHEAAREQAEQVTAAASAAGLQAATLETTVVSQTSERERIAREGEELLHRATVAEQTVQAHFPATIPPDAAARVTHQQQALQSAITQLDAAHQAVVDASGGLEAAKDGLTDSRRELAALDAEIAVLRERCDTMHGQLAAEIVAVTATAEIVAVTATAEIVATTVTAAPVAATVTRELVAPPAAVLLREGHLGGLSAWCTGASALVAAALGDADAFLHVLDRRLTRLATDLAVPTSDGQSPGPALKAAEREARDGKVRAEQAVQHAQARLRERRELEAAIADAQSEAALLGSLAAELRADRFIQFIIQQTLDLLAVRASEQLMTISAGRYSLVSYHGEFEVIDHVNADERRSVKTLSGGETFLASLALALALSQHVGELATEGLGAKLEAVFIDEGFGSLDPETLEDVIDALERLRESNLMVGVITHVPALAQRIGVGIRIEKGQNKSTVIEAGGESHL
jgi:exonuclease SbcC